MEYDLDNDDEDWLAQYNIGGTKLRCVGWQLGPLHWRGQSISRSEHAVAMLCAEQHFKVQQQLATVGPNHVPFCLLFVLFVCCLL